MKIKIFNHSHPSKTNIKENNTEKLNEEPKRESLLASFFKRNKFIKPSQQFYIGSNLDTE